MRAYITQRHHWQHTLPVWNALSPSLRGQVYVGHDPAMRAYVASTGHEPSLGIPPPSDTPVLVASGNELVAVKRAILLDHGVGQSYVGCDHVSWAGGSGRENVVLFIVANEIAAAANRARYPQIPNAIVGSPHVEALRKLPPYPLDVPRVAISTHWDCNNLVPELRSGWAWFEDAYEQLCRANPDGYVLHGHPRAQDRLEWKAREWGVEFVSDFAALTQRAWCYVTDNSSTLYEWAALGRPVVVVSPPWYRREVEHGLRFWRMSRPGPEVADPTELEAAISLSIADPSPQFLRRQWLVHKLFGEDLSQGAAARAASAIERALCSSS